MKTVGELIKDLQQVDPSLYVTTIDGEYGYEFDPRVKVLTAIFDIRDGFKPAPVLIVEVNYCVLTK